MLSKLKKTYYYSFDCIFWDFEAARWKYFIPQNKIEQLPNDEARWDDVPEKGNHLNESLSVGFDFENAYERNEVYKVEMLKYDLPKFKLVLDRTLNLDPLPKIKELKDGDWVVFKLR